jgi:hypothetical protein
VGLGFPTERHRLAAAAVAAYFSGVAEVDAVLQVGSCARGKAAPDSCLDIAVLVRPEVLATERAALQENWDQFHDSQAVFREGERLARYAFAEVDFFDGSFEPGYHGYTSGPDEFELEIGNRLVYSVPLLDQSSYLGQLKAHWLPYYGELLRGRRLAMVRRYGLNNLDHVAYFAARGLHFQAFHRLYDAYREFLQALFISRRTYPIAYDKWIREQVVEILGLPELYRELPALFEIGRFESEDITGKATRLSRLYEQYVG